MAQVFSKYDGLVHEGAVNIMRPSKWGNPFSHLNGTRAAWSVKTRDEAVAAFRFWLANSSAGRKLVAAAQVELRGKDLLCCCAPKACHGDVLLNVANREAFEVCAGCGEALIGKRGCSC